MNTTSALIVLALAGVACYFLLQNKSTLVRQTSTDIASFEECAAAGYTIMESYPEQCRTPDGRNFTRQINAPVACTMDAMMCPDGSYVGRTGPNCEFVCPN